MSKGRSKNRRDGATEFSEALARIETARRKNAAVLDLSHLDLTVVPSTVWHLQSLRTLNLSHNKLAALPDSFYSLTNLRSLDLSNNKLKTLPESWLPPQLRDLAVSNNQLTSAPESIGNLTQLRNLDFSDNRLTVCPESIGRLSQLQNLSFSGNQLAALPGSICRLTKLSELYVFANELTKLPEPLGKLTNLKVLDLRHNKLRELPASLRRLTQLCELYLAENELGVLPLSLGELIQLQSLTLSNNNLSELPESLGQLRLLQGLRLDGNKLKELPESLGRLTQLRSLDLAGNRLAKLPESLRTLRSLTTFFLHDNDSLAIPAEVLGSAWDVVGRGEGEAAKPAGILEYYFRLSRGRKPLNEAKLILVGRGAVGKTSIVNQLVDRVFKSEKKTEGIKITEWNLRLNPAEEVRLNVWDFGGQEIMHATHQFFLTQRSLYLLVLNGREGVEDADAEYWLKLIESFGGDSPVIVVLNKIKEHAFDVNRRALQQKYPIREFIKTDCEDGTGIEELSKAIARETDRLEDLRKAFPTGWFTIKDKLATMKANYLSFDRYREICEEHGETNKKAQQDLAGFLHRLGIVLNYRDDPRLQDTHVLSPHWVTDGIYKILNSDKLEKQRGEIRLNDLAEILDGAGYPANMRRFVLDLMKKFVLCFSFPSDDTHYLIPELLDKQEPIETAEFTSEECLSFQYHYTVLPEGLLPRFIVRTHALSEGLPRWRTGVIMRFEGCLALVKADVHDRRVFVFVSGPLSSRRRLLAVIRSDFERIHRDIRNLQPDEMVPVPRHPELVVPYNKLLVMEQRGIRQFAEVSGDDVIELGVSELLNGVDIEGTRRRERMPFARGDIVRLFYSYSHKDEGLRNELETHLKLLQRRRVIDIWSDRKIEAGDDWREKIDENLERSDIILLLVSADFIASDYCYEREMKRALEREKKFEARVIPVIVRDVNWSKAPFAKFQVLPKDGLAVTRWPDRDSAWRNVSEGVEAAVEEIQEIRSRWPATVS